MSVYQSVLYPSEGEGPISLQEKFQVVEVLVNRIENRSGPL